MFHAKYCTTNLSVIIFIASKHPTTIFNIYIWWQKLLLKIVVQYLAVMQLIHKNISTYVIRLSGASEINYFYRIVKFFQAFINMNCWIFRYYYDSAVYFLCKLASILIKKFYLQGIYYVKVIDWINFAQFPVISTNHQST